MRPILIVVYLEFSHRDLGCFLSGEFGQQVIIEDNPPLTLDISCSKKNPVLDVHVSASPLDNESGPAEWLVLTGPSQGRARKRSTDPPVACHQGATRGGPIIPILTLNDLRLPSRGVRRT